MLIRRPCGLIGDYGLKHRSVLPVLNLAATRLFRLSAQFADLVAKVREGRLPAQRTTRRRADPAPAPAKPPGSEAEASTAVTVPGPFVPELPRLPRDFGWLLRLTPGDHWVRGYRGYIEPTRSSRSGLRSSSSSRYHTDSDLQQSCRDGKSDCPGPR